MAALSRRKGGRAEREIVALARAKGLAATRTWHTAQSADPITRRCDVTVAGRPAQVKVAADGFKALYEALDGVEVAFLRADRRPWLAVIPAKRLLALLAHQESERDNLNASQDSSEISATLEMFQMVCNDSFDNR